MDNDTGMEGSLWADAHRARRAILVVDVVESVRLMQANEADVIDRWRRFVNDVRLHTLPGLGGRLVRSLGDGLLLEFLEVPAAAAAAIDIHRRLAPMNVGRAANESFYLRIGAHVADVVVDSLDIFGTGVNLAARLATLAGPGETVISADMRDQLVPGIDGEFEDLGDCYVKHLAEPVRAYRLQASQDRDGTAALQGEPPSLVPLLAVLPLDGDGTSRSTVVGTLIAERTLGFLSRSKAVDLVSRLSTSALQGRALSLQSVKQALRAQYVLSGRCQLQGDALMASVELADVESGRVLWADSLRGNTSDLLGDDCGIAYELAERAMWAIMSEGVRRARTLPLRSLDGYALLVGGISLMHRLSRQDFDRARELFETLVDRMPRHPAPRAWLAKWHVLRWQQGWTHDVATDARHAQDFARRALDIDADDSLALAMDGLVNVHLLKQLDVGEARYRQAIEINPNESLAWLLKGALHAFRGEGALALHDTQRALKLSPLDPMRYYYDSLAASAAASAGEYQMAIELAQRSLRANATHTSTLRAMAISQSMLGRMDDARSTVERLLALEPGFTLREFRARAPGADFEVGRTFAKALGDAGVPD